MERKDIGEQIKEAFESVKLGSGIGLYQAEAIDNYASNEEVLEARATDREAWEIWNQIPANVIATYYSALCFVDAEGMRFLLPAYMLFAVENYDRSNSASIDSVIYALDRGKEGFGGDDSILSIRQKAAIASFLKYMVLDAGDDWIDAAAASSAYEKHWAQYENEE